MSERPRTWEELEAWVEQEKERYRERYGDEPFARMRKDTEELRLRREHADTIKIRADLYKWINLAERSYNAGRIDEALYVLFEALTSTYARTYVAAPKITAARSRDRRDSAKAKAKAAFTHAFQSNPEFRSLQPAEQRDYLREHDDACRAMDRETLRQYVCAFAAAAK